MTGLMSHPKSSMVSGVTVTVHPFSLGEKASNFAVSRLASVSHLRFFEMSIQDAAGRTDGDGNTVVRIPVSAAGRLAQRCDAARAASALALNARLAWTACAVKAAAAGSSADVVFALLECADSWDPRTEVES